jgi:amino acid adenylation domain-containing protein
MIKKLKEQQKIIWLLQNTTESLDIFNLGAIFRVYQKIDVEKIKNIFKLLVIEFGADVCVVNNDSGLFFKKKGNNGFYFIFDDLSSSPSKGKEINKIINKEISYEYNFEKDPLIRITILKIKDSRYVCVLNCHQILFDYWSFKSFLEKLNKYYTNYFQKENKNKNIFIFKECEKDNLFYWKKRIIGYEYKNNFLSINKNYTNVVGLEEFFIPKNKFLRIKEKILSENCTLFIFFLCLSNILLYKITAEEDILIGTYVNNRKNWEENNLYGFFINNLLIRNKIKADDTFLVFLSKVKKSFLSDLSNSETSYRGIVKNIKNSAKKRFGVLIQYINNKNNIEKINSSLFKDIKIFDNSYKLYNLSFIFKESNNSIKIQLHYAKNIFNRDTIKQYLLLYNELLNEVLKNPNKKIVDFDILNYSKNKELISFCDGRKVKRPTKTINQLFQKSTAENPERIAIEQGNRKIKYKELNNKANQLANYLINCKKIKKNKVCAIEIERSIEMIIAVIAVHKAGGCCLLLNKKLPSQRKKYLLKNSGAKIVLEDKKNYPVVKIKKISGIDYVDIKNKEIKKQSSKNPKKDNKPNDLAYVVYTSGSTGKPKGVLLTHKGVLNHALTKISVLGISRKDRVAFNLSTNFVASIWQIVSPLIKGAKVIVYSENKSITSDSIFKFANDKEITILEITPILLNLYLNANNKKDDYLKKTKLKYLILTGERVFASLANNYYKEYNIKLINAYGQAECSDDTLHYKIKEKDNYNSVPVGTPSDNTQVYILDKDLKLLPKNIPGELYVSGDGLAKGYINNKKETKKSFLPHPYKKGKIIYKTGDRALMHSDGNIEILGRIDNQIKINGKRIELGEIESVVKKMINIEEAIGVATEDINKESKQIALYYKVIKGEKIKEEEIRSSLKKELPDYMIPKYYFRIKKFPLNSNGKIDRKKLPKVDEKNLIKNKYEEPKTETEKQIAEIWKKVLKVKKVGRNDNFFDLGGDSIKIIKLYSLLNLKFKKNIKIQKIFNFRTLKEYSKELN